MGSGGAGKHYRPSRISSRAYGDLLRIINCWTKGKIMIVNDFGSAFFELLSPLFIALPVSYVSVKLALRKFKSEKWWDKKLQCYTEISELLSGIVIYADMVIDIEVDGVKHDESAYKTQMLTFNSAIIKLQVHSHASAIILDKNSYKAVQDFTDKFFRVETSTIDTNKLAQLREEAESCLSVISSNARRALGV